MCLNVPIPHRAIQKKMTYVIYITAARLYFSQIVKYIVSRNGFSSVLRRLHFSQIYQLRVMVSLAFSP